MAVAFADSSIVVLALPDLYGAFDTTLVGVSWVITSYNLVVAVAAVVAVLLVAAARPAPGRRRCGLVLFTASSVGCAASVEPPDADRLPLRPGARAPRCCCRRRSRSSAGLPDRRERGIALWTTVAVLGAALGPVLGGVLTQLFDWRAIFVVQAPLAGAALLATGGRRGHACRPRRHGRRGRGALAADAALALVFAALVGALFLAVLLVITVWGLEPIAGALVVSALPAATLAARPLGARTRRARGRRRRRAAARRRPGSARAAAARLERARRGRARVLRARDRAGGAGAHPRRRSTPTPGSSAAARSRSPPGTPGWSSGSRSSRRSSRRRSTAPGERALLGGTKEILDANVPLIRKKVPIALALRDALESGPEGRGARPREAVRRRRRARPRATCAEARDSLVNTLESALTRGFRSSFGLAALFALLALVPGLAVESGSSEAACASSSRRPSRCSSSSSSLGAVGLRQAAPGRPVHRRSRRFGAAASTARCSGSCSAA